jgi:tetratricopeptide (TPR) repeat protein
MFTDVSGFTALMERSEEKALEALATKRASLRRHTSRLGGTLVKLMGDGALCTFPSVPRAVRCAELLQRDLEPAPFRVRIGIHWGEVLFDGSDVLGDAVNVASRLESIAPPGGILVSGEALGSWRAGRRPSTHHHGLTQLKGLGRLVSVYSITGAPGHPLPVGRIPRARLDRGEPEAVPSLAVMLLRNLGREEDSFYSYGITADLAGDLSRAGCIRVASMTDVMKAVEAGASTQEAARLLGVRYVSTGTLARSGDGFDLSMKLEDTASGRIVWQDRWSDSWRELPGLEGKLADGILKALGVGQKSAGTITAPISSRTSAYETYLRARQAWNTRRSIEDLERARELLREALDTDETLVPARLLLGETYRETGEYEAGRREFTEALELARDRGDSHGASRAELAIGITDWIQGRHAEARLAFTRVLRLSRLLGDRETECKALNNRGLTYVDQAVYGRALKDFEAARAIAASMGYRHVEASAVCNIGLALWRTGSDGEALERYREALGMLERMGDASGTANMHLNIGACLNRMGRHEEASEHSLECLRLSRELADPVRECKALSSLGTQSLAAGRPDEASGRWSEALAMADRTGNREMQALLMSNMSTLPRDIIPLDMALELVDRSLGVCAETGDAEGRIDALVNLGTLLLERGDARGAEEAAREALELGVEIGCPVYEKEAREVMSRALGCAGGAAAAAPPPGRPGPVRSSGSRSRRR